MAERVPFFGERRRSPRYSCSGRANVYSLPLDGTFLSAGLRNLSLGGICLNLGGELEEDEHTELLLAVNTETFRATAMVKGPQPVSATRLQFTHISSYGRDVLLDLISQMAKAQELNSRLRSSRMDPDTTRLLLDEERLRIATIGRPEGAIASEDPASESSPALDAQRGRIVDAEPLVIRLDLYA